MSVFSYKALGSDGRESSGTLTAESRASAISAIMERGLHPVTVEEQSAGGRLGGLFGRGTNGAAAGAATAPSPEKQGRVSQKNVENFTRELANLLSGGVPLARALQLLRKEAASPAARYVWGKIHDDVVDGKPLAEAVGRWPKAFSSVYVAMVRAGEAGGFLDLVLAQIAEFRTRETELRGKVKAALLYPAVLAFMTVAVLTFLLTYFIPKFSAIFAEFGSSLPALTRFIIAASNVAKSYGLLIAAAVAIGVFALRRYGATDNGRRAVEKFILAVPVLGRVVAHFALVRFCRMLGTLLGAGVPLVASLRVAKEAIGNQTLQDTVSHAIDEVQRGAALSKSLATGGRLFPPSVIEMVAVAEETSRLDKELVRLSAAYEADLDRQLRMLVALAEPIMLFVMAGVIGTIVVGMLLPVFNIQEMVK
ncbi:MAG TPA: type II secretion system F family protein [Tepidisphaeraceae bacterium]|nr:type II secretion system F family protein [Tepidisphaeraceae bacterium]